MVFFLSQIFQSVCAMKWENSLIKGSKQNESSLSIGNIQHTFHFVFYMWKKSRTWKNKGYIWRGRFLKKAFNSDDWTLCQWSWVEFLHDLIVLFDPENVKPLSSPFKWLANILDSIDISAWPHLTRVYRATVPAIQYVQYLVALLGRRESILIPLFLKLNNTFICPSSMYTVFIHLLTG